MRCRFRARGVIRCWWLRGLRGLAVSRLRAEQLYFGQDAVLEAAIARLQARGIGTLDAPTEVVIPARYRMGDAVCSFFSTITQFGSTTDVAMSELKIEMFFPADAQTRALLEGV